MAEITNGPRTYTLKTPVKVLLKSADGKTEEEQEIPVLSFRKPLGKDFRSLDKGEGMIDRLIAFGAQITDQPERVFDKMEAEDFTEVMLITKDFLKGFQAIGGEL